jgi:hypothetical protein
MSPMGPMALHGPGTADRDGIRLIDGGLWQVVEFAQSTSMKLLRCFQALYSAELTRSAKSGKIHEFEGEGLPTSLSRRRGRWSA